MTEVETIQGWKPPVIYDVSNDTYRIATQDDIDRLQAYGREASRTISAMKSALAVFENWQRAERLSV